MCGRRHRAARQSYRNGGRKCRWTGPVPVGLAHRRWVVRDAVCSELVSGANSLIKGNLQGKSRSGSLPRAGKHLLLLLLISKFLGEQNRDLFSWNSQRSALISDLRVMIRQTCQKAVQPLVVTGSPATFTRASLPRGTWSGSMGFRFRRSIRIMPGVRLNLGKRGVSTSIGVRGAQVTIGKTGVRQTVGIPGTGLSWTSLRRPSPSSAAPVNVQHGGLPSRISSSAWRAALLLVAALVVVIFILTPR